MEAKRKTRGHVAVMVERTSMKHTLGFTGFRMKTDIKNISFL